jgi:hypothetical protein
MWNRDLGIKCLLAVLMGGTQAVFAQASISDLPDSRCTLKEVIGHLQYQSIERRAAIAEQTMPLLSSIEVLLEKVKVKDKPVGEQLSRSDLDKFSRSSQQLQTMQLTSLIESRRLRDLNAIVRMAILADQEYRWSQTPKDGSNDAIYHAAYQLIILASPKLELTEPKTNQCTLEYALHILPRVQEASSYYRSLISKYKIDPIDSTKLTATERTKYDDYENNVLSLFRKHYSYIKNIQSIKVMARALEFMHQASLQDIAIGGGSFDTVGKTIQRNIQNKNYDESTQLAIGIWTKINEKIPSQDVQDWAKYNAK